MKSQQGVRNMGTLRYRLFHKIHLRIVSPTSLCTVLERGVFTLYCTQSPPTPLYRGGRFDYRFYCIIYGDTINYIPICMCSPLQLFYCMLYDCCICGSIERVSVPVWDWDVQEVGKDLRSKCSF